VGHTLQFTAHVTYSDGSVGELPDGRGNRVTWWGTSNSAVATVSSDGNVTAVGAGKVNIEAKVGRLRLHRRRVTASDAVAPPVAEQPNISCSANQPIINQGGTTTITAIGDSAQNLPLTYTYSSSAGSISGNNTTATLETSGVSAGIITVTCAVYQQGGGTASATINILVQSVTGAQALSNFQFTDSVGVNVHLAVDNTPYVTQFPQILQSMVQLGIKHYRDGLNQYVATAQYENAEMLGKAGIKTDWLMDFNNTASLINSAYALAPDATETFEGPNEEDANVGSPLLAFMQLLNNTVRSNPATATMPIIAPSFVQPSSFSTQGNLGPLVNKGNTHDYFGNRNPETAPYGGPFYNCGAYGSMQFNICLAQMVAANDSVIATETGYQSGQGLSDAIIGRYEVRTLFESLSLGITKTYLYELIDNSNCYWGLLTANFSPKPAYTAIQNVLSLLRDVNFGQPGKLNYTLTGQSQNVDQVLLQKSNGTFYLAIWLGVQGADPDNPSTTYNVAPQSVILTINSPIAATTTYVLDDGGNMTSTSAELTNGSLSISVTDRVTLVALSPGQSH
jgi:Bacterial Ig-like domain (group 2)